MLRVVFNQGWMAAANGVMSREINLEQLMGVPEWYIDVGTVALFLVWFSVGTLLFKTEKQRAYVIAVLNAIISIVIGVYVCHVELGWDFSKGDWMLKETVASRFSVRFFRAVQVLDVVLGLVFYPSQLYILTTWIHHTAYTLLCNWMLQRDVSILFAICLIEEVPTLIMSLGRLANSLRSDLGFGATYCVLRIALHTFLCYNVFTIETEDDRIAIVRFNFALTWCLHVNWFVAWIQQQIRLWKQNRSSRAQKVSSD